MGRFAKSRLAARMQMMVSKRRLETGLYEEIAGHLPLKNNLKVLDIGTGNGLMLEALHEIDPTLSLYGLDLSAEAIKLAKEHLKELEVDLRQGNIEKTDYTDGFFDIATCNASMSYWDHPVACFNEIHRILKPGGGAVLIEPHKEIDIKRAIEQIKENMRDENPLRRWLAVALNRYGLEKGNQAGMHLYSIEEMHALTDQSLFKNHAAVEEISLQRIPIFAKITLTKK